MCDTSERSFIFIEKDSNSFKSWTEVSKPESQKSTSTLQKQNNKFNKIFKGTYLENNLTPTFQSTKNNDKNSLKSFNIDDNAINNNNESLNIVKNNINNIKNGENDENEHKKQPNINGVHNSCTSDSSRVPFSWAEIAKIHPKFPENGRNLPKIKEDNSKNKRIQQKKIKPQLKQFLEITTDSKQKVINKNRIKMKKKDYV